MPSGQNSSVGDALNVTGDGSVRTAPSWFGRVTGSLSFAGYFHFVSLHRSLALSFASGLLGLPINSTTRYLPVSGQLKRMRIGRLALTAVSRALLISAITSRCACPSFIVCATSMSVGSAAAAMIAKIVRATIMSMRVKPARSCVFHMFMFWIRKFGGAEPSADRIGGIGSAMRPFSHVTPLISAQVAEFLGVAQQ